VLASFYALFAPREDRGGRGRTVTWAGFRLLSPLATTLELICTTSEERSSKFITSFEHSILALYLFKALYLAYGSVFL
jgi:hypothetical protein